jgi:hypothetical protein
MLKLWIMFLGFFYPMQSHLSYLHLALLLALLGMLCQSLASML